MKTTRLINGLFVAAGAAQLLFPVKTTLATQPLAAPAAAHASAVAVSDVRLTGAGSITGQVVDSANSPLAGAIVTVSSRGRVVAQSAADQRGEFTAPINQGGVYVVSAAGSERVVRTWTEAAAPPSAQSGVLLVAEETAVRGQAGDWITRNIIPIGLVGGMAAWIIVEAADDGGDQPSGS